MGPFPLRILCPVFWMLLFQTESEGKVLFIGQCIISELPKISILTIIVALERGERTVACHLVIEI